MINMIKNELIQEKFFGLDRMFQLGHVGLNLSHSLSPTQKNLRCPAVFDMNLMLFNVLYPCLWMSLIKNVALLYYQTQPKYNMLDRA